MLKIEVFAYKTKTDFPCQSVYWQNVLGLQNYIHFIFSIKSFLLIFLLAIILNIVISGWKFLELLLLYLLIDSYSLKCQIHISHCLKLHFLDINNSRKNSLCLLQTTIYFQGWKKKS